jgi:hypothetical protein
MAHPYLKRRAQIIGFFSILLVFATAWGVVVRLPVIAVFTGVSAAVLLALAIYSQIRFGPRISEVPKSCSLASKLFSWLLRGVYV